MSVGGTVFSTVRFDDRIDVVVRDGNDYTAVYLARTEHSEQIRDGDLLWWQSGTAYWSRQSAGIHDVPIPKITYSRRVPKER